MEVFSRVIYPWNSYLQPLCHEMHLLLEESRYSHFKRLASGSNRTPVTPYLYILLLQFATNVRDKRLLQQHGDFDSLDRSIDSFDRHARLRADESEVRKRGERAAL